MKTIAFFNTQGGVGKTTLVYHVAWMCAELDLRVLAVDLSPQANLTAMFLDEDSLEVLWEENASCRSLLGCVSPIMKGLGDFDEPKPHRLAESLELLAGNPGLSQFEDRLSDGWPRCLDGDKSAFRVLTAFYRIIDFAAKATNAEVVLIDVGPSLGAINRASLIASDHVVIPLAPGLFSLQGIRNLGTTLHTWRESWGQRLKAKPADLDIPMPAGSMKPAGYVIMQHVERKRRPVKAYQRWVSEIPEVYEEHVLQHAPRVESPETDTNRIGFIKNYQSLMTLAEDARKPVFKLTAADGAIGAHAAAVSKCYMDFRHLTEEIIRRTT